MYYARQAGVEAKLELSLCGQVLFVAQPQVSCYPVFHQLLSYRYGDCCDTVNLGDHYNHGLSPRSNDAVHCTDIALQITANAQKVELHLA